MSTTRRAAVFTAATAAAAIAVPAFADSIEDIAARNAAAAEAARNAAPEKTDEELEAEKGNSKALIGAALVGSVGLSVPFYWKNIARLATKVGTGGKDDGYNKYKN